MQVLMGWPSGTDTGGTSAKDQCLDCRQNSSVSDGRTRSTYGGNYAEGHRLICVVASLMMMGK